MALAAREWLSVRDSSDPQRHERFERHFAGTFHAEEARALREKVEAEARQRAAEEERQAQLRQAQERAQEQKFRAEDRIPVLVGDRNAGQTRWLLPGAGEPFCDLDGGPEMIVPAGTFMMGSPDDETERDSNEGSRLARTLTS